MKEEMKRCARPILNEQLFDGFPHSFKYKCTSMFCTVRCSQCSHIRWMLVSIGRTFFFSVILFQTKTYRISCIVWEYGALQFKGYRSRLFIELGLVQIQTFRRTNVYFHYFVSNCLSLAHSRYEFSFFTKNHNSKT